MIPQNLAIMTTYKCNFSCYHCSVSAGPEREEVLSKETMKGIIEEAYFIPSIRVIIFTGGEPTLFPDLLSEGIKLAHKKGFVTRLVTNGWWAQDYRRTYDLLKTLKTLGLDEINMSYDDFHVYYLERYGGEQNLLNVVRAATDLGITVVVETLLYPEVKITSRRLRRIFKSARIEGVLLLEDFITPLGRARQRLGPRFYFEIQENNEKKFKACKDIGRTLTVLPDGRLMACCGHIINTEAQFAFTLNGPAFGEPLIETIRRIQRNMFYWWLHLEGPEVVLREIGVNGEFRRNCEVCFHLVTTYRSRLLAFASKKENLYERLIARRKDAIPG